MQQRLINEMHHYDVVRAAVSKMTNSDSLVKKNYLKRSAKLIRQQVGVENIPNHNAYEGTILLDHDGPRVVSTCHLGGMQITRKWKGTHEFLILVASFCDLRSQAKYESVHDQVVQHFMSCGSPIPFIAPIDHKVLEKIYGASVEIIQQYQQRCLQSFTYRVVSLDSSYKCMMSVVDQPKHGQGSQTGGEIHNVHVLMADRRVIACKAGFAEQWLELFRFVVSNMKSSYRAQTEVFLLDSPDKFSMPCARILFPKLLCIGGDPMHVCFNIEKFCSRASVISKDCRIIFAKFWKDATYRHRAMDYYDKATCQWNGVLPSPTDAAIDRAYARLHTWQYAGKAYLTFEQYVIDLMAVKKHNPKSCAKKAKRNGSKGSGYIGQGNDDDKIWVLPEHRCVQGEEL